MLVDVVCTGRFYDFLEKRGHWAIVRRQPIYEKDRMDPVDPAATLTLDAAHLARFPEGYRHLAYLQSRNGFTIKDDLPGLRGPAVETLYSEGAAWLDGLQPQGHRSVNSKSQLPTSNYDHDHDTRGSEAPKASEVCVLAVSVCRDARSLMTDADSQARPV